MTFLAPGFLYASLAVAAAVVALHLIVTRQPRAGILPTARFIPDMPATATARATRPSDLLLMLLRVATVLAVGAGLAKPVLTPSRGAEARVILADVSRSARDSLGVRDSVRALYRDHDALIVFDSSARLIARGATDSIPYLASSGARGNISAGILAALREASSLRDRADSIELVIVSPFAAEELDASTPVVRSLWPGRARIVKAGSLTDTTVSRSNLEIRAAVGDPLRYTVAAARSNTPAGGLIVRDGTAAFAGQPGAVIDWPVTSRPRGAVPRSVPDTIGGVIAGDAIVISSFERRWRYPADSLRNAEVIARWVDGEPAAIEQRASSGCVRSVAVPVTAIGDLVISTDFVAFVGAVGGECAAKAEVRPANPAQVTSLAGTGGLAPRGAFKPGPDVRSDIAPWLIGFAIAGALIELVVRRRKALDTPAVLTRQGEAKAA